MNKKLISGLAFGALSLSASGAWAATDFYLVAKQTSLTMPDGTVVTMWGFADDPGGACYNGGTPDTVACDALTASVPGPALRMPVPNGTAGEFDLNVHLTNLLSEPVSLSIPGQPRPASPGGNGPTWTDGTTGPRTGAGQRVRSFGLEAAPGGTQTYSWVGTGGFKPGSYLYHSGTHPSVQVQMGLYGEIAQDNAAGEAYPGVAYDNDVSLIYSEIDPDMHAAVVAGNFGDGQPMSSAIDYRARYFLVNGEATLKTSTPAPIDIGAPGERTLLRMHNAGYETHVATLQGLRGLLVAEDGSAYPHPRDQHTMQLHAMKSRDMIVQPGAAGTYPLYDRALSLSNSHQTATDASWGLLSYLQVAIGTGAPQAIADEFNPGGVAAVAEGGSFTDSVAINDVGAPAVYTLISGPSYGTLDLLADGSFTYTHDGGETTADAFVYQMDNGVGTSQAVASMVIAAVNDAPVAVDDAATTDENVVVSIAVLSNDSDVDNSASQLSVVALSAPGFGAAAISGIQVDYTPAGTSPTGSYPYTDSFTYDVSDGAGGTATATVIVTVNEAVVANQAPVAVNDNEATSINTSLVIDVLANDSDDGNTPPSVLPTVQIVGNGLSKKGGALVVNGDGTVTYTPPRNVRGSDFFDYELVDAEGLISNKARVKITITK